MPCVVLITAASSRLTSFANQRATPREQRRRAEHAHRIKRRHVITAIQLSHIRLTADIDTESCGSTDRVEHQLSQSGLNNSADVEQRLTSDHWCRICAFDSYQNLRPSMTLDGRYAIYCRKDAYFGAHCKIFNEDRVDRPILSAANMQAIDSCFWKYNVHVRIYAGIPLGGGV